MPDERRHESADLEDYEVGSASDTLDGNPGDEPLDRGVITPQHWSAGMKFGTTATEQQEGESLDQRLAEEEPDTEDEYEDEADEDDSGFDGAGRDRAGPGDAGLDDTGEDEDTADEYVDGLLLDDGPDPRSGRLVAQDEGTRPVQDADLVAHDAGIDGGAASAEEAAVHVVGDDDTDIRSGD